MPKLTARQAIAAGTKLPLHCYALAEQAAELGAKVYILDESARTGMPPLYVVESAEAIKLPAKCGDLPVVAVIDGLVTMTYARKADGASPGHIIRSFAKWGRRLVLLDRHRGEYDLRVPGLVISINHIVSPMHGTDRCEFHANESALIADVTRTGDLSLGPAPVDGGALSGKVSRQGAASIHYRKKMREWTEADVVGRVRAACDDLFALDARPNPRRRRR